MKFSSLVTVLTISTVLPTSAETGGLKRLTNVIDSYPQLSKDGKMLVFQSNRSGAMQIYTSKADGSEVRQITHLNFAAATPCWSPDMKRIVFAAEPSVIPKSSL